MHWYGDYRARNLQQEVYETKLEITIFPTLRLTKCKRLHLKNVQTWNDFVLDMKENMSQIFNKKIGWFMNKIILCLYSVQVIVQMKTLELG